MFSQIYVGTKLGIENPLLWEYNVNALAQSPNNYVEQKFKFFRTKIYSLGIGYQDRVSKKDYLFYDIGVQVAFLDQFIADTILSPQKNMLIYDVNHRALSLEPNMGITINLYKKIGITGGMSMFLPLQKKIISQQETVLFKVEYEPRFYRPSLFLTIGLRYVIKSSILEVELVDGGGIGNGSRLWVREPLPWSRGGPKHAIQRWMLSYSYLF